MAIQTMCAAPSAYHQAEADRAAAMQAFECTFAMFSEVAADACRLGFQGADVHVDVGPNGLHVTLGAPIPVGPLCIRSHSVNQHSSRHRVSKGQSFEGDPITCSDHCVTDRFYCSYHAPLSEVEHIVETILRRFALMDRNMDACRVWGGAA